MINLEQKPKVFSTLTRKFQSKVSKALEISILITRLSLVYLWCNMLMASDLRQIQSLICLWWMKPLFSSDIIEGRTWAIISTRTMDMILNLKFYIAIGLNWLRAFAFEVLGRRTTLLEFMLGNNQLLVKNSMTIF